MENKPTIYISSTIYDFEDIRSSLKYWLEEQGYEVLLSETNDFPVNRSKDSYQACLDAIERCDYFILFIGSRVGGLFDKNRQISITRQEYRKAYELAQQGRVEIINFIRKPVWNYRHSQKELENYLKNEFCKRKEITPTDISLIMNRQSDFATNAQTIMSFIDEVAKIKKMKEAQDCEIERPLGNWIHVFSTFREIIDCLKIEFAIDDKRKKKLKYLLTKEICENLTEILLWHEKKGVVLEACYDGNIIRTKMTGHSKNNSLLDRDELTRRFFNCWITSITCEKMTIRYISQSIDSGLFLKYNNHNNKYEKTKLSDALWLLQKEIQFLKKLIGSSGIDLFRKYYEFKMSNDIQVEIKNKELSELLSISDRRYNIIYLSKAILRAINGKEDLLENFVPKPFSPFVDIEEDLKKERPDEDKVLRWAFD